MGMNPCVWYCIWSIYSPPPFLLLQCQGIGTALISHALVYGVGRQGSKYTQASAVPADSSQATNSAHRREDCPAREGQCR